jgi:uncharacterized protein YaiE (UPF0345 family)
MPSVDVITGAITPHGASIAKGSTFEWKCTASAQITVIAQGSAWFSPSPTPSFTAPSGSATVTAEADGNWTWTATGVNVDAGAHVIIQPSMPAHAAHERKAS